MRDVNVIFEIKICAKLRFKIVSFFYTYTPFSQDRTIIETSYQIQHLRFHQIMGMMQWVRFFDNLSQNLHPTNFS